MSLPPVIEAAERAVRSARQWGMSDDDVRKLTRVEVSADTLYEMMRTAIPDLIYDQSGIYDFQRSRAPLICRGVSYYVVRNLPLQWRVFSIGLSTRGVPTAYTVDGPPTVEEPRDREHEFDEASKQH